MEGSGDCGGYEEEVARASALAGIKLDAGDLEEICKDFPKIAGYLRSVADAVRGLEAEPLYHVWETTGTLRVEGKDRRIDIRAIVEHRLLDEDNNVKVPWRGRR